MNDKINELLANKPANLKHKVSLSNNGILEFECTGKGTPSGCGIISIFLGLFAVLLFYLASRIPDKDITIFLASGENIIPFLCLCLIGALLACAAFFGLLVSLFGAVSKGQKLRLTQDSLEIYNIYRKKEEKEESIPISDIENIESYYHRAVTSGRGSFTVKITHSNKKTVFYYTEQSQGRDHARKRKSSEYLADLLFEAVKERWKTIAPEKYAQYLSFSKKVEPAHKTELQKSAKEITDSDKIIVDFNKDISRPPGNNLKISVEGERLKIKTPASFFAPGCFVSVLIFVGIAFLGILGDFVVGYHHTWQEWTKSIMSVSVIFGLFSYIAYKMMAFNKRYSAILYVGKTGIETSGTPKIKVKASMGEYHTAETIADVKVAKQNHTKKDVLMLVKTDGKEKLLLRGADVTTEELEWIKDIIVRTLASGSEKNES